MLPRSAHPWVDLASRGVSWPRPEPIQTPSYKDHPAALPFSPDHQRHAPTGPKMAKLELSTAPRATPRPVPSPPRGRAGTRRRSVPRQSPTGKTTASRTHDRVPASAADRAGGVWIEPLRMVIVPQGRPAHVGLDRRFYRSWDPGRG